VHGASNGRAPRDLKRGPATAAADIRDPAWRIECKRLDQRRVNRCERRFQAGKLIAPFLAARGGPV
jgi:hypothetical protein